MQHQFLPPESSHCSSPLTVEDAQANSGVLIAQDSATRQQDTQAVTALLAETRHKIRRRKRRFWGSFAVCEGTLLFVMLPICFVWHDSSLALPLIGICLAIGLTAMVVLLSTMSRPNNFDANIMGAGGAQAVPLLLDSLVSGMTPERRKKEIYPLLAYLLPQMKATDANLLMPGHRRLLNRLLNVEAWPRWYGPKVTELALSLAILKAYEQVGDSKAIPIVEKVANVQGKSERAQKIRQAAQECLPLLYSHTVPLDHTQTLLRAAAQSSAAPVVLLRPASETAPACAGELLRASEEDMQTR